MKAKTSVRGPVPVLAAILILASESSAQAQVTLGLRAGAMRGTLGVADEVGFVEGVSPRYGAQAAVSVAYPLNDLLGLVAEVGYAQRGADLTLLDIDVIYGALWAYDYVDFSMLGKVFLGPAYLLAGPTVALRTACYTRLTRPRGRATSSCEELEAVYRENDFLLTAGAGAGLDLGSATLVAEGLYGLGLLDINDSEDDVAARHRGFALRIGVDIRLRRARNR